MEKRGDFYLVKKPWGKIDRSVGNCHSSALMILFHKQDFLKKVWNLGKLDEEKN